MWCSLTRLPRRSQAIRLGVSSIQPESWAAARSLVTFFMPPLTPELTGFPNHFPARHRAHRGGPLTDRVPQHTKEPITATT